jgi:hypothetical protein
MHVVCPTCKQAIRQKLLVDTFTLFLLFILLYQSRRFVKNFPIFSNLKFNKKNISLKKYNKNKNTFNDHSNC